MYSLQQKTRFEAGRSRLHLFACFMLSILCRARSDAASRRGCEV